MRSPAEIREQAEALRAHVARIERHGHVGMGYALEPHDVDLLNVMRAAADTLDQLAADQAADSAARA